MSSLASIDYSVWADKVAPNLPCMMTKSLEPTVSIIVPVRNEQCHIARCLDAICAQDYPAESIEVICVDGMSDDGTRAVVSAYAHKCSNIQLLDNPAMIVPPAMNIGIRASQGDIIIRVDARCIVEPDYVAKCVYYLQKTGAQNVGGTQKAVGGGAVSRAIALATTSPFGIGNSKFHYSTQEQFVDTVYLGAYPREVFDQIGLYDESLVRNQDYELNHRLRKAGGRIFFTPKIRSVYYGRPSLRKLWKQYFQYGFWKVRVLKKHPDSLKWRHLVAPLFVLSLIMSAFLSAFWSGLALLVSIVSAYAAASLIASVHAARKAERWWHVLLLPLVFSIVHLSWGVGFWWSVLTLPILPKRVLGTKR